MKRHGANAALFDDSSFPVLNDSIPFHCGREFAIPSAMRRSKNVVKRCDTNKERSVSSGRKQET